MIYKLLSTTEWDQARDRGSFAGSAVDRADGFVHFSTADQLVETARRHFSGLTGLTLLTVETARLGGRLRWEASRGGALFPHLYGPLPVSAVVAVDELPDDVPVADAVAALLPAAPPDTAGTTGDTAGTTGDTPAGGDAPPVTG